MAPLNLQRRRPWIVLLVGLIVFMSFQNCSKTNFEATSQTFDYGQGSLVVNPNGEKTFTITTDTEKRYPSDVLFVVDESVSMDAILDRVKQGFSDAAVHSYPASTRLAVMNMAPAKLNGNIPDFSTAFVNAADGYVAGQPGFVQMVTRSRIASFKTNFPSRAAAFTETGCEKEWFSPEDKDANGVACLIGASQIALQGIGTETGVVSLKQMILRATTQKRTLFRTDAALTVIFVSDTHDPGSSYYGKAGAEAAIPTFAAMKALIYKHQPALKGLQFNAIVPLPMAGNAALSGVRVIGALPANASEENVSGEGTYGYSYLKLVAASGGSAMHVAKNSWNEAITEMVKGIGVLQTPIVTLPDVATEILTVKVNGVVLQTSDFVLQADGKTIQIPRQSNWGRNLDIVVIFK